MTKTRNPVTNPQIDAFEREQALVLPRSYREFLLATNGGVPIDPGFRIRRGAATEDWVVQVFLGIGVTEPTSELSYPVRLFAGAIPHGILPVGSDEFGNYICLDLRHGDERVAFWDKRDFWGTGIWNDRDLYSVAPSFDDFIASLRPRS